MAPSTFSMGMRSRPVPTLRSRRPQSIISDTMAAEFGLSRRSAFRILARALANGWPAEEYPDRTRCRRWIMPRIHYVNGPTVESEERETVMDAAGQRWCINGVALDLDRR